MKYEIMEQETCSKIQQTIKVMHFLLTSHECDWCICVCVCLCSMPQLRLFSFCCQVRAKCQNSELGVCIWLCVCKYGSYSESSNYASAIQICLCVCVCACACALSRELSELEQAFSLLWLLSTLSMLSSRMLSVCFVWITDKSPSSLSPLAPIPSITFCVSFLVAICSLFLCLDVAFVFCVLCYAACLMCTHGIFFIPFYFKLRSLGFLNLPFQLLCLLTFLPLLYSSFLLFPFGFPVSTTIQLFLSPSETICCDRDIMWKRQL